MIMCMSVEEILENIDYISYSIPDDLMEEEIFSLCQNSRYACPACMFFCKVGAVSDGHMYAGNAYLLGARLFVIEREIDLPEDAGYIIVKNVAETLNKLAVIFYQDPGKALRLIGITGTKGKTTVALSVYRIASSAGIRIGYIGTNGVYFNGDVYETVNTTPDAVELQKYLHMMRDGGVDTVVIEVSSQALWQDRVHGLHFDTCVFTNLYEDHIGGFEHPSMEHYLACKKKLFRDYGGKNIVVNADSPEVAEILDGVNYENLIRISAKGDRECDLFAVNTRKAMEGVRPGIAFDCDSSSSAIGENVKEIFIPLPGLYSAENGLLTLAICRLLSMDTEFVIQSLSNLRVPGRFETVALESRPDSLFVIDYAHNGASLEAVLKALREYEPKRIICLFGSVGGRTFGRRAELGRVASEGADVIILTADNPDNEDPMRVIKDIRDAIGDTDKPVYMIPDRREAIEKAYEIAEAGDFVLLAGKGHESYQLILGQRIPFSERRILEAIDEPATVI